VCLNPACYRLDNEVGWQQKDGIEQRITFDPRFRFFGMEMWFLRPGADLGRWQIPYGEVPPKGWYTNLHDGKECDHAKFCLLNGIPLGAFSRFYDEA
jgi:hypothetical protein